MNDEEFKARWVTEEENEIFFVNNFVTLLITRTFSPYVYLWRIGIVELNKDRTGSRITFLDWYSPTKEAAIELVRYLGIPEILEHYPEEDFQETLAAGVRS